MKAAKAVVLAVVLASVALAKIHKLKPVAAGLGTDFIIEEPVVPLDLDNHESDSLKGDINTSPRSLYVPNYLLRNMDSIGKTQELAVNSVSSWLDGYTHYRLVPGIFLKGMNYHFDGLATVLKFSFKNGKLVFDSKSYESDMFNDPKWCIIYATGYGPTLGTKICFRNPVVNLLPINDQLWLTIDTYAWGRIDKDTLATIPADTDVNALTLNAHPACDWKTKECFVQHPCSQYKLPLSSEVCVSKLVTTEKDLKKEQLAQLKAPKNLLLQHSHSPCVTENYVVSKLDFFGTRSSTGPEVEAGLLKNVHQIEDNLWIIMNRQTKESRILSSDFAFVNNHFWNCYEKDGNVVVDTVAATDGYLDTYFEKRLQQAPRWTDMFHPPKRCYVPFTEGSIKCENLLVDDASLVFDYPTFNPSHKMDAGYKWFYGIAPATLSSKFFDQIVKFDAQQRKVSKTFSMEGLYFTEADFVARPGATAEDDGVLLSVVYNSTSDSSHLAILNAENLQLEDIYELNQVIPFHAHGIVCDKVQCFSNP